MLKEYIAHEKERARLGIPPKPLTREQTEQLVKLCIDPGGHDPKRLYELLSCRVPAGADDAAGVKARFLADVAWGRVSSPVVTPKDAVFLLGTMGGGYNISHLIGLLSHPELGEDATDALGKTIFVYDAFSEICDLSNENQRATNVLEAWARAEWFLAGNPMPKRITVTAFRIEGEVNTDDLSPASEAWSRPDIPLHALSMLSARIDSPLETIAALKKKGLPLAFVADVAGTGSSRKSASNSLVWHIGQDIPYVPNKRRGGIVIAGKIAPIFFNSLEDAGAIPIECDVSAIRNGDIITIDFTEKRIFAGDPQKAIAEFELRPKVLPDEVRAGGRIRLITGRDLTAKARKTLGMEPSDIFLKPDPPPLSSKGYTLAQKIVGKACGKTGVRPGEYCEPKVVTVGSQDTTGPMTKDELIELACFRFSSDLVMQSFCHTAAYPRRVDIEMQKNLSAYMQKLGGISLKPGDGIIHSWINRMILPDTVGTGGDSHTRFPVGISFPAGSGLVAFAAASGIMPLDMPQSVLVKFSGKPRPGIFTRDMVNAIPYAAIKAGLLTVEKAGKKNVFSGRIIEIEGADDLSVQEAFELTNSSAERSAAAAVIRLSVQSVKTYIEESKKILESLLESGYQDADAIKRRISAMEAWLEDPKLLEPDIDASYHATLEIDLDDITEPIVACPNDPDDVRLLTEVAGTPVDEVFIGSCMTRFSHFVDVAKILEGKKDTPARLWIAPPTRLDAEKLKEMGLFATFAAAGARIEIPGCSLCMGNQARVRRGSTVFSTSTRNFPNRMGDDTRVFLGSPQLAAVCAILGKIPEPGEYAKLVSVLEQ